MHDLEGNVRYALLLSFIRGRQSSDGKIEESRRKMMNDKCVERFFLHTLPKPSKTYHNDIEKTSGIRRI